MRFEVPGKPQGKQRAKVSTFGGFARAYTPKETVNYENLICISYKTAQKGEKSLLWDKPLEIQIMAYCPIPKSFSKKKIQEALSGNLRPPTKPDVDNIAKVVCDALNSVAYHDDSQVIRLVCEKFYSNEPKLVVDINEFSG